MNHLASLLGLDPFRAAAVAGEVVLLEAGGCLFCAARSLRVLCAATTEARIRTMLRDLERLYLFADAGRCLDCEEAAA